MIIGADVFDILLPAQPRAERSWARMIATRQTVSSSNAVTRDDVEEDE
jgi:hypothetical protein